MLIDNWVELPAVECIQRTAEKKVCTEEDFIKGNKLSFGDSIGSITNVATSMICLQSSFEKGTKEYEELGYRIIAMQHFQQNSIDRAKGIISEPMPTYWRSSKECRLKEEDDDETRIWKEFNEKIAADKKPYFMRYRYNQSNEDYKSFIKKVKADYVTKPELTRSISEIISLPDDELSNEEQAFKKWYNFFNPLDDSPCTINKICHIVEDRFDNHHLKQKTDFDYSILKSGVEYSKQEAKLVKDIYKDFKDSIFELYCNKDDFVDQADKDRTREYYMNAFRTLPMERKVLTDILLDLCYAKGNIKDVVWEVCGEQIIDNLLESHNHTLYYPYLDSQGEFQYLGNTYAMKELKLNQEVAINEED